MKIQHQSLAVGILLGALLPVFSVADEDIRVCTENTRECMITTAETYIDSITTHDASKVPLAQDVKRTEQGRITGSGADEIRTKQKMQPDMLGHVNTRYFVDEATRNVVVFTLLQVTGKKLDPSRKTFSDRVPQDQRKPSTVHLAERFKIVDGLITEIEAIFYIEEGTMKDASHWPDR